MFNEFYNNVVQYPRRNKPVDFSLGKNNIIALPVHMPHEPVEAPGGKGPVNDGWESLDGEDEGPVQSMENEGGPSLTVQRRIQRWCAGAKTGPLVVKKTLMQDMIYPQEEVENPRARRGIHSISMRDGYTNDLDDCNDWGGLIDRDILGTVTTDTPVVIGDSGPPRTEREKTAEFYYNFFREEDELFHWLIPGVLAGGGHPIYYSFQDNLTYLRDAGFKALISACESPLDFKYVSGLEYYFIPTVDGYSSHLVEACEFISQMEARKKPVFVHCFAGHGRTGTILAAYLIYKNHLTVDEAIAYIRQKYNKLAIETSYQVDELRHLANRL